ncbi:MAG: Two component transcriptional regulator, winged helix family [Candidatus Collierbacteria bacterium GW2011_GWB1_44_6]|uniref:Two component transcriptional regulator, winged helix family n=1 Tax=Candidatus Collierbacteria bacterium GW2011_GWB1_44_6 TaxID=1618384 RepID=A0A0G1MJG4_9BACT|nr:MAG: Two component transcriptional regulator, winged helix family [Candidatus Collierbacteria bacterium GW2011_GWB1_44_6]KKT82735.1 MAG: winged helix family two component transcriptional regulator, two-component system, OmpR family, copper resistance phosphate regulon response regulator CusR [Microgenomates group bacterium GW2011_GWC1_44_9]
MRLLLIEDDKSIAESLTTLLKGVGYGVDQAFTKNEGWEKAFVEDYDLIILDWMLPDGKGTDLCRDLREEKLLCPILMLTAKSMIEDIENGLDSGADDYLTKPFEMRELLARIRALVRRKPELVPEIFRYKELVVDIQKRQVMVNDSEIKLSVKEFSVLEYLIRHQEKTVERDELLSHVWDEESDVASNIVDVYVSYLRKKIDHKFHFDLIKTIKGKGYSICDG